MIQADYLVIGTIYTGGVNYYECIPEIMDYMAIKDGRIIGIGDQKELQNYQVEEHQVLRLKQGCVIPGIIETHAHASAGLLLFQGVDLYEMETVSEYWKAIDVYIKKHPGLKYIKGRGFINSHFGDKGPCSTYLDQTYPEHFFYLESEDCHSCLVSKNVLEKLDVTGETQALHNGVICVDETTGLPTGWLKEKEMERVREFFPKYKGKDYKNSLLKFQKKCLKNGITAVYEPLLPVEDGFTRPLQAYLDLEQEGALLLDFRIGLTIDPSDPLDKMNEFLLWRSKVQTKHVKIIGMKIFIDGVLEGHTAFLKEPYADQPETCGESMWNQEKLQQVMELAYVHDLQIHVHVIGDAALDVALDAFEAARRCKNQTGLRDSLTHLQVVRDDQIRRMRDLNLIAVTNPYWHYKNPDYYEKIEVPYLGKERAEQEYPMASFFKENVVVTMASDWPVTYINNPLIGIEIAMTRKMPGVSNMSALNIRETICLAEALNMATLNGAIQLGIESEAGSLECGKRANFVILNQDIGVLPPMQLTNIKILETYMDGKKRGGDIV